MTLDTFNLIEIEKRLSKISDINSINMSFEKDLKLHIDHRIEEWEKIS